MAITDYWASGDGFARCWLDGAAICVKIVSPVGDPRDLSEAEVEGIIEALQRLVRIVRGETGEDVGDSRPEP